MSSKSKSNSNLLLLIDEYMKNISNPNSSLEFEIRFGTKGEPIKKIDFDNVAKKLLSMAFTVAHNEKHTLKINTEFRDGDGNMRYSNIRTEIYDLYNITQYCKTNKLNNKEKFIQKYKYRISNPPENPIDNKNYNFRVSLQEEKEFNKSSRMIQTLTESWNETKKSFRLINRTTLVHEDFPFNIDLSVVKNSKKDKGQFIMTYSLVDSNVFNNRESYEIEIEIDNDKIKKNNYTPKQIEMMLKKAIKYILSGLQQTSYPITIQEQNEVKAEYYQLINKKPIEDYKLKPKDFIGPSSYTLQRINIVNTEKTLTPNINDNYCVTDKADGLRKLLFINSVGKVYLIDMSMNIQFTGSITENKKIFNSLLDGEHILHDKYKKYLNLFAAFDAYYINNQDIRSFQLTHIEYNNKISTRLDDGCNVVRDHANFKSIIPDTLCDFNFIVKMFHVVNPKFNYPIHMCCKKLFEKTGLLKDTDSSTTLNENEDSLQEVETKSQFIYETDGIIFTPVLLGVGCNNSSEKPKNFKKAWNASFKWKPPEFNTIDFLITTKKMENNEDFIGNLFSQGIQTKNNIIQYKTVTLNVGFDETEHGYLNPFDSLINGLSDSESSKYNKKGFYKPVPFYPTNPFDPNAHICNIILTNDINGKLQMFTTDGEVIEDNMIVEFKYDLTKKGQWRWIPIKVRYDKTAEFRNGFKNFGNAYHVANSNWQSIHNPITPEMLSTDQPISLNMAEDDTYYLKVNGISKTENMRDFHNLFVKKLLINIASNPGDLLIDFAVGKGGDFPKWKHSKLGFVLGIDLSRDNIENKINGACARYLNEKKKVKDLPKVIYLQGNTGLLISNGEAFSNESNKKIMKALKGEGTKDQSIGSEVLKMYGIASKGFNVSSIQFALHYMFENTITLHKFLKNVCDFTKKDGYFIGTCFNGHYIFDMLKQVKYGEEKNILVDETKIWAIKKKYHSSDYQDNEKCVGYEIYIYQETINKYTKEYLVNFNYLTQILQDYGFSPLTNEELKTTGLSSSVNDFKSLFDMMQGTSSKKYGKANNMTDQEKTISFLNQYFIYKKRQNVNSSEVFKMYTDESIDKPVDFTISKPVKLKERLILS